MTHPYSSLPARNFWKNTISKHMWSDVFLDECGRFTITNNDLIGSAGSCFAQRISQLLKLSGRNFKEFETAHPLMSNLESSEYGYGRFSARYGNIYTTKQLRQLIEEAFQLEIFPPKISKSKNGIIIDLRRPNINSVGFDSYDAACFDRQYHLSCIKKMFEEIDVFIFTFGLTEAWIDNKDGVVFGTHPSVALGLDSKIEVSKINYDYIECFNDMVFIINFLRSVNEEIRFIFTVSPVALAATHQDNHVIVASTYSKSILRSVAGKLVENSSFIDYFPSYELFSSAQSFGQFLSSDLRDVNIRGVDLVMKLFQSMYFDSEHSLNLDNKIKEQPLEKGQFTTIKNNLIDVECDEIMNSLFKL